MTARYPLVLNGSSIQELQSGDSLAGIQMLPTGGTTHQLLAKISNADSDAGWTGDPVLSSQTVNGPSTLNGPSSLNGDVNIAGSVTVNGRPLVIDGRWYYFSSSTTFTVPSGVTTIRAYAGGAGGNGGLGYGGGGGGFAFGNIAVSPGDAVTISIGSDARVISGGVTRLIAYPASGQTGGTAFKDASVTSGGAYSGGAGGSNYGGGGSCGSPLGNGYPGGSNGVYTGSGGAGIGGTGGDGGGGGGAGGAGASAGGGAGGPASGDNPGVGRTDGQKFSDPLIAPATGAGNTGLPGGGGARGQAGGSFAGGGAERSGGIMGGGGSGIWGRTGTPGGNGGPGGGGGGAAQNPDYNNGLGGWKSPGYGGPAFVYLYV